MKERYKWLAYLGVLGFLCLIGMLKPTGAILLAFGTLLGKVFI